MPLNLWDYNESCGRAQMIEKYMMEHMASMSKQEQTPTQIVNRDKRFRGKQRFTPNKKRKGMNDTQSEACRYCGKQHNNAPCRVRTRACFRCG